MASTFGTHSSLVPLPQAVKPRGYKREHLRRSFRLRSVADMYRSHSPTIKEKDGIRQILTNPNGPVFQAIEKTVNFPWKMYGVLYPHRPRRTTHLHYPVVK